MKSKRREWKAGWINKGYLKKCNKAARGTKTIHRNAAINKPSTLAGKIVAVPPKMT